jgi:hypothetical protein
VHGEGAPTVCQKITLALLDPRKKTHSSADHSGNGSRGEGFVAGREPADVMAFGRSV